jgi:glyoxylase-like metal-dependent hydrolase (beta-lactamase superfamily II)
MIKLKTFVFGAFQENTYLLWGASGTAWIVDPGMMDGSEEKELEDFIKKNNLTLTRVLLTHGHVDHVFGCRYLYDNHGLVPEIHSADLYWTVKLPDTCRMYGLPVTDFPEKHALLDGVNEISLDGVLFKLLHVPGHSPGGLAFYSEKLQLLISGDALFNGSIGRTDFPGGDYDTLIHSIRSQLFTLPDNTVVYSGHGPKTTIGHEKAYNPFFSR